MKITDKIITSTIEPQLKNVMWHNPETGELKIFGNKGWEVVGGNPGEGGSGGYPVVTVEDNFNIEAEPNTFYNIKNNADSEININFNPEELYITGKNKMLLYTFDNLPTAMPELFFMYAGLLGVNLVADNSREGYKYKAEVDMSALPFPGTLTFYYSDYITDGANIQCLLPDVFEEDYGYELKNIKILNKNINYIHYLQMPADSTSSPTGIPFIVLEQSLNDTTLADGSDIKYCYKVLALGQETFIYSNDEINNMSIALYGSGDDLEFNDIKTYINIDIPILQKTNHYIFNIKTPSNIIFNQNIHWNNDDIPSLDSKGICTISILNGVGCYTFVNS